MPLLRPYKPPRQYVPSNKKWEESVHRAFVHYMNLQYPRLLYRTDGAGLLLTKSQAGIYKSLNATSGWPDIQVVYPNRGYHGLFIEIKKENVQIYCKTGPRKGKLVADPHIQMQAAVLQQLNDLGYFARFGVGFDNCSRLLDWYMGKQDDPTLF